MCEKYISKCFLYLKTLIFKWLPKSFTRPPPLLSLEMILSLINIDLGRYNKNYFNQVARVLKVFHTTPPPSNSSLEPGARIYLQVLYVVTDFICNGAEFIHINSFVVI